MKIRRSGDAVYTRLLAVTDDEYEVLLTGVCLAMGHDTRSIDTTYPMFRKMVDDREVPLQDEAVRTPAGGDPTLF